MAELVGDDAYRVLPPKLYDSLDSYIEAEGKVLCDTVGAYQFEGRGAQLVETMEGDMFSVVGLPLLPLLAELRRRGAIPT